MMKRHRLSFLITAWLGYAAFTLLGHPFFGKSVMLPSILLCGYASWLYGYKTGLLTLALSVPYNVLTMAYHLGSPESGLIALDIGGIAAQLSAVLFICAIKRNHRKCLELTTRLETRIQQRNAELETITECLIARSKAERSRMSEALCGIVAHQQTGLYYHSEALMNFLVYSGAPQAHAAKKLVEIARQNMEQLENTTQKLSSNKILMFGIEQALQDMCAYFSETADIKFTISISSGLTDMREEAFMNIYRIAHEAVNNAMRHGKATHISLELKRIGNTCTLEVVNNGEPIPSSPGDGLGMRLIHQRADQLHAATRLESIPGSQTRFECVIPLDEPSLIGSDPDDRSATIADRQPS